jgi:hypothetical protein
MFVPVAVRLSVDKSVVEQGVDKELEREPGVRVTCAQSDDCCEVSASAVTTDSGLVEHWRGKDLSQDGDPSGRRSATSFGFRAAGSAARVAASHATIVEHRAEQRN